MNTTGDVKKVFFGTGVVSAAHPFIQNAEKRVWVVSYVLPSHKFLGRLIKRAEAGVDVRVVISANTTSPKVRKTLRAMKANTKVKTLVTNCEGATLHSKFIIADDQVMLGSSNWSEKNSHNCAVQLEGPVVRQFVIEFNRLWALPPADDLVGQGAEDLMKKAFAVQGRSKFLCTVNANRKKRGFLTPREEAAIKRIINKR